MKIEKIPAQRRQLILALIQEKRALTVHQLAAAASVSLPTIRRDLDWLAKAGAIDRSHGGAVLKSTPSTIFEPDYHVSETLAREEKIAIGRKAASRLKDNQSVLFDSSSTVFEAAKAVAERGLHLTAITNDIRIGELLAVSGNVRLLMCGGTVRPGSFTLIGEPGTSFLSKLHVDVSVIGIHAVNGATCADTSLDIACTKQYMVEAAANVLMLADSSKFGKVAFYDAFCIEDNFEVITDGRLEQHHRNALEKTGAAVTVAEPGPSGKQNENVCHAEKEQRYE